MGNVLSTHKTGDRVVANIADDGFGGVGVRLQRILDESSPEIADFTWVVLSHDLPQEFPPEVLAAAENADDGFDPTGREDLRDSLIITIDPDTAKDFDDAISLEILGKGRLRLGVHR